MKILHVENIGGVPAILAEAQRSLGHEVHVLETWRFPADYPHDYGLYYEGSLTKKLGLMRKAVKIAREHDVVHIHGGIHRRRVDLLKMAMLRPAVVHYHGSDARQGYGLHYQWTVDKKLVATPDLVRYVEGAEFVPNPVRIAPAPFELGRTPTIIHMANDRRTKGTELILEAIQALKADGVRFDFVLMEKRPYKEAYEALSRAHILVDQVVDEATTGIPGLIGMATLEAMAMGKAAVCHVDPDMLVAYPGLPVVNVAAEKDSLKGALKKLVEDMNGTKRLGEQGLEYVRAYHDPQKIAKRLIAIYESIR